MTSKLSNDVQVQIPNMTRSSAVAYSRLNSSYKDKLIFRFGDSAGFFSEYNNMILAVLYCLDQKIKFSLYTSPSGSLSIRDGWNDYFLPFCEQTSKAFHRNLNKRIPSRDITKIEKIKNSYHKLHDGFRYFTFELWNDFRSKEFVNQHFNVPELSIKGDLLSCTSEIIKILWQYNDDFGDAVAKAIASFNLPKHYVGIHLRGGDKVVEAKLYSPDEYMAFVKGNTSLKDVFLLTDDYRYVEYLRSTYTDYRFFISCREEERGYDFLAFSRMPKEYQRSEYVKLLASMDVMRRATLSFGTRSSNPGMFLGMCMGQRFLGIDCPDWIVT